MGDKDKTLEMGERIASGLSIRGAAFEYGVTEYAAEKSLADYADLCGVTFNEIVALLKKPGMGKIKTYRSLVNSHKMRQLAQKKQKCNSK